MKILITGGAGFIGSAVVRLAIARGHSVVNLDALTYAASLTNLDIFWIIRIMYLSIKISDIEAS